MTFELNQIFEKTYPPQCAIWCNENGYYINEIEPLENGTRQFQICAPQEKTQEQLEQEQAEKELAELNTKIEQLKTDFFYATMTEDTEQIEKIKSEYNSLIGV